MADHLREPVLILKGPMPAEAAAIPQSLLNRLPRRGKTDSVSEPGVIPPGSGS